MFGKIRNDGTSMPRGSVTATIPATSAEVFRLLHDYSRRLEWDTLLQNARLCDDLTEAGLHATSVCTGRWYLGGIALKTEYVSFNAPHVAAVKMLNRPPFFETFAATIRHHDLGDGSSSVEYKYNFTARPRWLRWLLHPVMGCLFRWETRKRLGALRRWFSQPRSGKMRANADGLAEQSHALEPAAGPVSNGKSSPPAQ
ncbi:MAG: SRPBCC family protein [Acidobacteria bacterium]|nr:SRPBCC family protein [Acidobacteriota bacterium]